jgi:squalene-hopene/tetraprenyl-beta-curcumene cyclase
MQCRNGGWGSFDKDCTKMIFENIPFADHNAMLDPPTADITGRILEMLAAYGYTRADPRVERAVSFILSQQEPDGSWFGRWGVNYVYGTFLVLRGLDAIGVDRRSRGSSGRRIGSARAESDGGWGETCGTYDDPITRGIGAEHAVADGLGGPGPAGRRRHQSDSVARGVRWLLARQRPDGSWDESTGTGPVARPCTRRRVFPRYFIWRITCIDNTSRCWPSPITGGPWNPTS